MMDPKPLLLLVPYRKEGHAGKRLQGFEIPEQYGNVLAYLETIQQRPSWKATYYSPELVIAGWQRHLKS